MALRIGEGHAAGRDEYRSGSQAAKKALKNMERPTAHAAVILAAADLTPRSVLDGVRSVLGDIPIAGVSTAGEIIPRGVAPERTVVVNVFHSPSLSFSTYAQPLEDSPEASAEALGRELLEGARSQEPGLVLLFGDGLAAAGEAVGERIWQAVGEQCPIVGGGSADRFTFDQTCQYRNGEVLTHSIVALTIYGSLTVGVGASHGWSPISRAYSVTANSGDVIREIEGRSALDFYSDYFGEYLSSESEPSDILQLTSMYPLGVRGPERSVRVLRHPVKLLAGGAVQFSGRIPAEAEVQLMIADPSNLTATAREAARQARSVFGRRKPAGVLVFNGAGRKRLVMDRPTKEVQGLKGVLGRTCPLSGGYTYGQYVYSPRQESRLGEISLFHNDALVVCALG